jgi:hypothetical protein
VNIPRSITAGDSLTWNDPAGVDSQGALVSSAAWTLTYFLRFNAASEGATVVGTAGATGSWDFTVAAATTTAFDAGTWSWTARATNGALAMTMASGTLTVLRSLAYTGTPAAFDGRSQNEIDLAAVQAAIRTIISGGVSQYAIGSRQATKLDLGALMKRESQLKAEVARERAAEKVAAGLGDPRNLFVRFGS